MLANIIKRLNRFLNNDTTSNNCKEKNNLSMVALKYEDQTDFCFNSSQILSETYNEPLC